MARHPVAVLTKQRPQGNNRAQEASDDEGRKKRCTVPSPQREAVPGAEQALRDYEDYLCYYGLKEYCTQYVEYSDCVERLATDATTGTVDASASEDDEPNESSDAQSDARDTESIPGDDEAPDPLTASVIVDAHVAACDSNCQCDSFAATQEEETTRDNFEKLEKQPHASVLQIPAETSWDWALASVGHVHVRAPSTSSSCTADSEGAASCASSWAKVLTPQPRRNRPGSVVDNEWEVVQVLAPDEESSTFL
jgi:hypothetical protein